MNHFPLVTIGLVLYKNEEYLKPCLEGLMNQDYPNIEFVMRDQSPQGEAIEYIQYNLPDVFQSTKIERGPNLWHSGGHNRLIRRMNGQYYIVASVDMSYPPDFVSKVIQTLEQPENRHYGSATCKLLKWDFANQQKTDVIDSCGIGITKSHHFYDIGQGEEDKGQYDEMRDIFGPSGALSIFRKNALDDIAYENDAGLPEYYDSLLHYKNDVDLAYRLQWAGHQSLFISDVAVHHDRLAGNFHKSPIHLIKILKGREGKSDFIRENSFFGQQVVLYKNYIPEFSADVRIKTALKNSLAKTYCRFKEPELLKQLELVKECKDELADKRDTIKFRIAASRIEKLMN